MTRRDFLRYGGAGFLGLSLGDFLRLEAEHISSWDFRKIPGALARRQAERDRGA